MTQVVVQVVVFWCKLNDEFLLVGKRAAYGIEVGKLRPSDLTTEMEIALALCKGGAEHRTLP